MSALGDPADKQAADQFQPVHSAGYGKGLEWMLDYFTRNPYATGQSGEAGALAAEVLRLRKKVASLDAAWHRSIPY